MKHASPISGIATHGGKYVATAGYDNRVILWSADSHTAIAIGNHDHLANQVSFRADGRELLTASSDHTARIWSVPDLKLKAVMASHNDDVEMAVYDPSGEFVATASRDHKVRVFDGAGQLVVEFAGHLADVISVAWSTESQEIISSSDDGTIKRWSVKDQILLESIDLDGVETDTIAISDSGRIFAGNDLGEILVIMHGFVEGVKPAHSAGIKRVLLNDQLQLLVSLSYDRSIKIWSTIGELALIATATLPAVVWPRSCAFLTDATLVFATFGSSYAVFDIETGEWDLSRVGRTDGANAVAVATGTILAIGDAGLTRVDGEHVASPGTLCNFLTPYGGIVVTGGQMGILYDATSGVELYQHRSPLNCGAVFGNSEESFLIVGTYTGEALVFQENNGLRLLASIPVHANAIKGIAASDSAIFSVCADTSATFIDTIDFSRLTRIPNAHDRIANGCAHLKGDEFASVSRDLKLRIWRLGSDRPQVINTPHDHSIKCVSSSGDGRYIATGSYNGIIAIYDRLTLKWATVRATTAGVSSLTFDSNNERFLGSSYDSYLYSIDYRGRVEVL